MKCEHCGTETTTKHGDGRLHESGSGWALHTAERCLKTQLAEVTHMLAVQLEVSRCNRDTISAAEAEAAQLRADNGRLREALEELRLLSLGGATVGSRVRMQVIDAALAVARGPDGKVGR